ncbi:nuclear transport factor 2 family protein, partial [Mycobacterium rufum]|nr:nuclear transport factor 2 family protein [Mycolicibacterium rufum]
RIAAATHGQPPTAVAYQPIPRPYAWPHHTSVIKVLRRPVESAARPYLRSMQHHTTTVNFAIDGDVAEGEVYTIATHTFAVRDHDVDVVVGGRYLDKYAKREATWKFVERAIVTDWAHVNDPSITDLSHPITRNT